MGWDTEIIIIAENVTDNREVIEIIKSIYDKDAKSYEQSTCFLKPQESKNDTRSFYYFYERRKVIPYWELEKISKAFPHVYFTALGDCPEFICGPAGIIKIYNGEIYDSYGLDGLRQKLLHKPDQNALKIYGWFQRGGFEDTLRLSYLEDYPRDWCDALYSTKMIPIQDTEELKEMIERNPEMPIANGWRKYTDFGIS